LGNISRYAGTLANMLVYWLETKVPYLNSSASVRTSRMVFRSAAVTRSRSAASTGGPLRSRAMARVMNLVEKAVEARFQRWGAASAKWPSGLWRPHQNSIAASSRWRTAGEP